MAGKSETGRYVAVDAKGAPTSKKSTQSSVVVVGDRVVHVPTPSRQALERAGVSAMQALRDKKAA
jgi:hypothetical protein